MLTTNGIEGQLGDFTVTFQPVETIYQETLDNCAEFFPWAIFIGANGSSEMFVIDKRTNPVQFGLLPYISDEEDFLPLGNTFEQFLSRLNDGTAFERL